MIGYIPALLSLLAVAILVGLALNMQWGLGGLVNFGLAGFYAVGAYTAALLSLSGVPPLVAALAAMLATALISALVSFVSLRLAEDHLAIVTLGFAELVRLATVNETWLTKGSLGLPGIPRPLSSLVAPAYSDIAFALLALLLAALLYVLLDRLATSPFGRVLRAVRDDDVVAATLGKNVLWVRMQAFAVSGAAIGLAGALHSFYYSYIDPGQFGTIITATAFMAVIMGGRGSNLGAMIGAAMVLLLIEGSRFLKDIFGVLDATQIASLRLMLIGLGLILLLIFRPQGLLSERRASCKDLTGES
jgi:ABC-type branched-subunit amino acid transport system permease subunit